MAGSPRAAALSEAHRLDQARLGAATVAQLLTLWPLLDITRIDATTERWLDAALLVLADRRVDSARLAADYLDELRPLELPNASPFPPVLAAELPTEAATTSLIVTGPQAVQANLARLVPAIRANEIGATSSARAGMRHVLNGGRETVTFTVAADPKAWAYRRTASGSACKYCAGLVGIEFADDHVFRPHDGCSCGAEPVYR